MATGKNKIFKTSKKRIFKFTGNVVVSLFPNSENLRPISFKKLNLEAWYGLLSVSTVISSCKEDLIEKKENEPNVIIV
jgi:hypothetical protein